MSIFERIHVMNNWRNGGWRYAWRFLLLPFGWDHTARPYLGWSSFSAFGFTLFWMYKLTESQRRVAVANGRKIMAWVRKHGQEIE